MKLTDIKKNADASLAKAKAERDEMQRLRDLDVHPLVKWRCDRNVRDAYFQGVVFAALTDDLKIDDAERKLLVRIGTSLTISHEDQSELMAYVKKAVDEAVKAGGVGVFTPLKECLRIFKDENITKLFIAEYVKVCGACKLDVENVREQLKGHLIPHDNVTIKPSLLSILYRVVLNGKDALDADLVALADDLGDDTVRYFALDVLGDVEGRLVATRKRNEAEAHKKKELERKQKIRADFDIVASQTGKFYMNCGSMPSEWKADIEERLAKYDKADMDFVSAINERLGAVLALKKYDRVSLCFTANRDRARQERRRIVWELVCLLWVSEKTVDPQKVDYLLRGASNMTAEGFYDKVEGFIRVSFSGIVVLE